MGIGFVLPVCKLLILPQGDMRSLIVNEAGLKQAVVRNGQVRSITGSRLLRSQLLGGGWSHVGFVMPKPVREGSLVQRLKKDLGLIPLTFIIEHHSGIGQESYFFR